MKITRRQLKRIIQEALDFQPTAKHLFVLIGLPSIGKSTWIQENVPDAHIISSDETMERAAAKHGFTYDDLFDGYPTQEQLDTPKLDQHGKAMVDNDGNPILKGYVHPDFGPIVNQQIKWKTFKPDAFQFTNIAEKEADDELTASRNAAVSSGKPIVIDMMNTSAGGRKFQISELKLPDDYIKVGVVFQSEGAEDDILALSKSRNIFGQMNTGAKKTIPDHIFHRDIEMPQPGEFDKVIYVDNRGKVKDFHQSNLQKISMLGRDSDNF